MRIHVTAAIRMTVVQLLLVIARRTVVRITSASGERGKYTCNYTLYVGKNCISLVFRNCSVYKFNVNVGKDY